MVRVCPLAPSSRRQQVRIDQAVDGDGAGHEAHAGHQGDRVGPTGIVDRTQTATVMGPVRSSDGESGALTKLWFPNVRLRGLASGNEGASGDGLVP